MKTSADGAALDGAPAVGVIGGGAFGRGLALAARRNSHRVRLYSRHPDGQALSPLTAPPAKRERATSKANEDPRATRRRPAGPPIEITSELGAVAEASLLFVAVPSRYFPDLARALEPYLDGRHLIVHVSRGLVGPELLTLTDVLREHTAARRLGALAGPLSATALAQGRPGGGVIGTLFPGVAAAVREALAGPSMRIYETDDLVGVQISSALVGVMTVVSAMLRERGLGPTAVALFCSRALAETTRITESRGGRAETTTGLAGAGDLFSAIGGDGRPEIALGEALGRGAPVDEAAAAAGAHVEGLELATLAAEYAASKGLSTPVATAIADMLAERTTLDETLTRLMAYPVGTE
ncbi:MAG: NAD(P)-binding domain-containing protein [Myxococcales bacterium]|nr:NAD(P)-binding domain-containing protein [Myxococcales bacterium]